MGGTIVIDGGASGAGGTRLDARSVDSGQPLVDAACPAGDQKLTITAAMLSASSSYSSYVPMTAFDWDMSQNSGWTASGGEQKGWLAVDFGTAQQVSRVRIFPDRYISTDPSYSYLDRFRVDVWGSAGWVAATALVSTPEEKWYEVSVNASTQKLQIWAESDGNSPQIKERKSRSTLPATPPAPIGIDAAVATDAAGLADVAQPVLDAACVAADEKISVAADMLSASSSYSSYVPITCFDGDMSQNSGWTASSGEQKAWLGVDFGIARQVSRVRVFPDRYIIHLDRSQLFLSRPIPRGHLGRHGLGRSQRPHLDAGRKVVRGDYQRQHAEAARLGGVRWKQSANIGNRDLPPSVCRPQPRIIDRAPECDARDHSPKPDGDREHCRVVMEGESIAALIAPRDGPGWVRRHSTLSCTQLRRP